MANSTVSDLVGNCIAPFLDASLFPTHGGFIEGRFCAPIDDLPGKPTCCLSCPVTQWTYSDSFQTYGTVAEWLNVVGLVLLAFMLISYIVLDGQQTRSHYLSICLIVSVGMIALGFTIPLAADPDQCYNEITPNDMYSSLECAWSGALIIAGGLTVIMWIFIRALSMNLQICWDIVPGRKFLIAAQLFGWGIPAILFTTIMSITGVSFRFGSACHVNHKNSMGDFWGPLLALAGAAGLLQLMTFGYCIHVYLRNMWSDQSQASSSAASGAGLPSYSGSVRKQTARAVYRRLKKVLWLQWRGICIVSIILVDVVFFSITFVYLDGMQTAIARDWLKLMPWLFCLAENPDDKSKCLHLIDGWLINEPTVIAVLLLLSVAGLQVFLLLARPAMFPAWYEKIRSQINPRQEFVSRDAKQSVMRSNSEARLLRVEQGHEATMFEMQAPIQGLGLDVDHKGFHPVSVNSPDEIYRSPLSAGRSSPSTPIGSYDDGDMLSPQQSVRGRRFPEYVGRITPSPVSEGIRSPHADGYAYVAPGAHRHTQDYFAQRYVSSSESRRYAAPRSSFSAPKPPSRDGSVKSVSFDPRETYIRGGLGLNPPSEVGESTEDLSSLRHSYEQR